MSSGLDFGRAYGGSPAYITGDGVAVTMYRNGRNKVRFYTTDGQQIGPEQSNVAPAVAFAIAQGWVDVIPGDLGYALHSTVVCDYLFEFLRDCTRIYQHGVGRNRRTYAVYICPKCGTERHLVRHGPAIPGGFYCGIVREEL